MVKHLGATDNIDPDTLDTWDKPREECGVFGVYAPGRDVARLAFFALYALQHRGQEGAGIVASDGIQTRVHKDVGLVSQIFNETNLGPLQGHIAIGHTRYSTTGSSALKNVQPFLVETVHGPLAVAHNGNITNAHILRQKLLERGVGLSTSSDSEVLIQMLAAPPEVWGFTPEPGEDRWISRIRAVMGALEGAYSLVILTRDGLYTVRDPNGLRPLVLGKLDEHYVVASETCAFDTTGAVSVREVAPAEILKIDASGYQSIQGTPKQRALCSFEFVYFARPDSIIDEESVHAVRQRMGRQLATESPAEADVVIAVPDSSIPAAVGYAAALGLPYTEGLIKNRYIGRTFIQPDDQLRKLGIQLKLNPLAANIAGKRIILVDDSIVRGNTIAPIVNLLRSAGATEVHVRVSSPPVRHPCFMGVDMATHKQLIAHRMTTQEIQAHINADSLAYLSLEGMLSSIGHDQNSQNKGYCGACFSGQYPIHIPEWLFAEERKAIFEIS
jgi:amidophosphoribosyltransferase